MPAIRRRSSQDDGVGSLSPAKRMRTETHRVSDLAHRSGDRADLRLVGFSTVGLGAPALSGYTSFSIGGGDSLWDQHYDSSSLHAQPSSLSGDSVDVIDLDSEDCYSPWSTPSESAVAAVCSDPRSPDSIPPPASFSGDYDPYWGPNGLGIPLSPILDANLSPQEEYPPDTALPLIDGDSFPDLPMEQRAGDREGPRPALPVLSDPTVSVGVLAARAGCSSFRGGWTNGDFSTVLLPSSIPIELVDPELRIDISSTGNTESVTVGSLSGNQGGSRDRGAGQPAAIDEGENIWEVEALLAKWKQGRRVLYLVKWKGFADDTNSWEKRNDISTELVDKFDIAYSECGGNHLGVELLDKRIHQGKAEYRVRWKGRPWAEDSWEKGSTISLERIGEFEAHRMYAPDIFWRHL